MAKIVVTGGAGYIGSHTLYFLEKRGHSTVALDNLERGHPGVVPAGMLRQVDLRDRERVKQVLREERVDAVIHFAAYAYVGESTQRPEMYFANNVGGSVALFEAMLETGVNCVVFSSTCASYGIVEKMPITEDHPLAPINPYGESKVMVERVLESLDRFRGMRSVRLRYFNASGGEPGTGLGEWHVPETHLIPLALRAAETGEPVTVFGDDCPTPDGTCVRDYIHVSDLAEAHILAVEYLLKGGKSNAFNLGTGKGHSVKDVLSAVESVTGRKAPYKMGPRREGDPPELVANAEKASKTLGWHAKRAGLEGIVEDAWNTRPEKNSAEHPCCVLLDAGPARVSRALEVSLLANQLDAHAAQDDSHPY